MHMKNQLCHYLGLAIFHLENFSLVVFAIKFSQASEQCLLVKSPVLSSLQRACRPRY